MRLPGLGTAEEVMKTSHAALLVVTLAFAGAPAIAQDSKQPQMTKEQKEMMDAFARMGEVRAEHRELGYFVGDWNASTTMWMDPKAPPQKSAGKAHAESTMGGRYIEMKFDGTMMDQPFSGRGVFGFDNVSGRYFNTWMDSMSTGFWLAYGSYDAASKTYTFNGSMDDPMKPKTKVAIREVVHVVDPTHYTFEWYETHAGKEAKTMQIEYTKL
jgi:hypothetical protein